MAENVRRFLNVRCAEPIIRSEMLQMKPTWRRQSIQVRMSSAFDGASDERLMSSATLIMIIPNNVTKRIFSSRLF